MEADQVLAVPPLGLATLAAYLRPDDEAVIVDEHVQPMTLEDMPELVVPQVYGAMLGADWERYREQFEGRPLLWTGFLIAFIKMMEFAIDSQVIFFNDSVQFLQNAIGFKYFTRHWPYTVIDFLWPRRSYVFSWLIRLLAVPFILSESSSPCRWRWAELRPGCSPWCWRAI